MTELSAQQKIEAARGFKDQIFWKDIAVPMMKAALASFYAQLRECPLEDVHRIRANLDAYEKLIEMPDKIIELCRMDRKIEEFYEQQNEQADRA